MKKQLLTLLATFVLSFPSFSQTNILNLNKENKNYILKKLSQEKIFNMDIHEDYCTSFNFSKDNEYIVTLYDFDKDGINDAKAYFDPKNIFNDAFAVLIEGYEGNPAFAYLNLNKHSEGRLETSMPYEEFINFYKFVKRGEIKLKPIEPILVDRIDNSLE